MNTACVLSLIVSAILLSSCNSQSCTERFMELSLLAHRARQILEQTPTLEMSHLADEIRLLVDIEFACSTTITNILLGANVRTEEDGRHEYPSVIVVRQGEIDQNYEIVARQTLNETTSTNNGVYHNYSLNPTLSVNAGETIGFTAPKASMALVTIHYIPDVVYNTVTLDDLTSNGTIITDQLVLAYPLADNQNCISVNNNTINADIVTDESIDINDVASLSDQHLYPKLQFSCNGIITKWIFGADDGQITSNNTIHPELQIWHQTGPDTYTKIGFSSVTANATASPNVHEYYPETTLQFQQGDVLGVYYPNVDESCPLLYVQDGNGPPNLVHSAPVAPSELSGSQLTASDNNFPLVLPVVAINDIPQPSAITQALASATTTDAAPTRTQNRPSPSISTALPPNTDVDTANTVAIAVPSTVVPTLVIIAVVVVVAAIMCIKKRKPKTGQYTFEQQPVPEYETLTRSNTDKMVPSIDIGLYSTVDYAVFDKQAYQYKIPSLKTFKPGINSNDAAQNGRDDELSQYTSLNVQELDQDNEYVGLAPPPSPRQPHPSPCSAPISLTNALQDEGAGDLYDYATTVRKSFIDDSDSEYI